MTKQTVAVQAVVASKIVWLFVINFLGFMCMQVVNMSACAAYNTKYSVLYIVTLQRMDV